MNLAALISSANSLNQSANFSDLTGYWIELNRE